MDTKFKNQTIHWKVTQAIFLAENALSFQSKSSLILELEKKNDWKYGTKLKGRELSLALTKPRDILNVYTYNESSKNVNATHNYKGIRGVHLSKYYVENADVLAIASTLVHEWAHECGFHHKSGLWLTWNWWTTSKSRYSVPYWLSDNFEKYMVARG